MDIVSGTILVLFLYLIPTWIAALRKHRDFLAVFACNVFFGWTVFGWFITFIWSLKKAGQIYIVEKTEGKPIHGC